MYQVIIVNTVTVVTFYNMRLSLVISKPDKLSYPMEMRDKSRIYFCIHSFGEGSNGK